MYKIITLAALAALSGCGIADHFQAQGRMDKSEQEYRACLSKHIENPPICEPLKAVWDADRANYLTGKT